MLWEFRPLNPLFMGEQKGRRGEVSYIGSPLPYPGHFVLFPQGLVVLVIYNQRVNRCPLDNRYKGCEELDQNIAKYIRHIKTYRSALSHSYVILTKLGRFSMNIL